MAQSKNEFGAGKGSFRQAQAWLHTWCGLWFSWLLYAVFLTGTLAVFEEPITHWMTPEHHAHEQAEALSAGSAQEVESSLSQRLQWGMAYMKRQHPGAGMWELWPADVQGGGDLRVYWFDANGQYAAVQLDPKSGNAVDAADAPKVRQTEGGHHFVDFHYQLHAGQVGLWIVGIAALAMFVALVSGVITHRRIFKDFFTFRSSKGQRSWLDMHNAVAVLTLPFQFMIAYTGIAISCSTFMPAGIAAYYGSSAEALKSFQVALNEPGKPQRSGQPMPVPDLEPLVLRGQELIGQPVRAVVIDYPGDAAARVGVYGWNAADDLNKRLSSTSGMAMFSAATGELQQLRLPGDVSGGAASLTQSVIGGLHMATYGGFPLKWVYFVCGLAGSAMMATGAILFMVKRRSKHQGEFGASTSTVYRMIEAVNVAAIVGLGIACVGFLWANRLLPIELSQRSRWELVAFFALWILALLHALLRSPPIAWRDQMTALAVLCLLLPVLNFLTTGDHLVAYLLEGDWESAGVELFAIVVGVAAVAALAWMRRPKAVRKKMPREVSKDLSAVVDADAAKQGSLS
ncbi:PepSY-associated TM helix domain-containing protein [Comamonas suwonensis]|uniref:PepSY-associated TM helix domain-containing protein n=1 Tax=Comamonas suwonensis TaxID=2606214 RepID=UPI00145DA641|nr:PepSY-associated TM helix domain-containing protein [Comamonas suwonensis]MBI1623119.1 PepSY domain-containing protein [Comamonas suwonensis]